MNGTEARHFISTPMRWYSYTCRPSSSPLTLYHPTIPPSLREEIWGGVGEVFFEVFGVGKGEGRVLAWGVSI
jgi:hypothetical protein